MAVLTGTRQGDTLVVSHHFPKSVYLWAVARILLGFTFLWAFLDKTFALGFTTGRDLETGAIDRAAAWINGASPTGGFLEFGTKGPFSGPFKLLAGMAWVDWLFMLGLFGIGIALILGVAVKPAAVAGTVLLMLMYVAAAPWVGESHNPLVDDHLIYSVVLLGLASVESGLTWGLGRRWRHTKLVDRLPWLA